MRRKYGNTKVNIDGVTFDSKREANRWLELQWMEKAGQITDLRRQVAYVLADSVRLSGRVKPALRYVADFVYVEGGEDVVEDAKGYRKDPVYRIKRHLMMSVHGIEIVEV